MKYLQPFLVVFDMLIIMYMLL